MPRELKTIDLQHEQTLPGDGRFYYLAPRIPRLKKKTRAIGGNARENNVRT